MFIYVAEDLHCIHCQACLRILYSALYPLVCFNLHQSVSLSAHLPLNRLSCLSFDLPSCVPFFHSQTFIFSGFLLPQLSLVPALCLKHTLNISLASIHRPLTLLSLSFSFFSDSHITFVPLPFAVSQLQVVL